MVLIQAQQHYQQILHQLLKLFYDVTVQSVTLVSVISFK